MHALYTQLRLRRDSEGSRVPQEVHTRRIPGDASSRGTFGELLRAYRHRAGLSQGLLAERAGLSLRGIQDLERGVRRTPYPTTARSVADALDLEESDRQALMEAAAPPSRGRPPDNSPPASAPNDNLPAEISSFVGRERDVEVVLQALAGSRLVTLVGPGGIGKSRLALRAATATRSMYVDGIWLVELGPFREASAVVRAVANVIGVPELPGRPLVPGVIAALAVKGVLLVIDNCEHLIASSAELVEELLLRCPRLQILATSREPLRVAGEYVWQVAALSLPDDTTPLSAEDATRYGAIQLFLERATATEPCFKITPRNASLVAHICRHLDGIPLAIELAAARVSALPLDVIASRLGDRFQLLTQGNRNAPSRHRTLESTVRWSYELCDQHERQLFHRVSVFDGSFSLEAAEVVCSGGDLNRADVARLLSGLVDKSLLQFDVPHRRYRQLETLREYGRARSHSTADLDATRRRHHAFFLTLAETAEERLWGSDALTWLAQLDVEQDNLRQALQWSLDQQQPAESGLLLAGALARYWMMRGKLVEGRDWFSCLLNLPSSRAPTLGRAKALTGSAALAVFEGALTTVQTHAEEALELWQRHDDPARQAFALNALARAVFLSGDVNRARELWTEALALSRQADHRALESMMLNNFAALEAGLDLYQWDIQPVPSPAQLEKAHAFAQAGLTASSEAGHRKMQVRSRFYLGYLDACQGRLEDARTEATRALDLVEETSDKPEEGAILLLLAWLATEQRHFPDAQRYLNRALKLGSDGFLLGRGEWPLAECARRLAHLAAARSELLQALRLDGALAAWLATQNFAPPQRLIDTWERRHARAIRLYGKSSAAAAIVAGRQSTLEEVVATSSGSSLREMPEPVIPKLSSRRRSARVALHKSL